MSTMDLVTPYHEYFQLVPAETEALKQEVYRIRYDVYCSELGWEDADKHRNGLETDEYDRWSKHCLLLHKPSNSFAGCVRLVRAAPDTSHPGIPLQEHCQEALDPDVLDIDRLPRNTFGEISRLAIRPEFRRRPGEKENPSGTGKEPGLVDSPPTSIISAPSCTSLSTSSTARPTSPYTPSPLNESGVRLSIPIM